MCRWQGRWTSYSHRLANRLAGNSEDVPALEITLIGPELQFDAAVICVVAGATFGLAVGDSPMPMHSPFEVPPGVRLRFGARTAGTRATLAVRGGIDAERIFGSAATSLISRIGPLGGRALKAGDILPLGHVTGSHHAGPRGFPLPLPSGGARLRVIPGPHAEMFTAGAFETLYGSRFTITPQSNRMGYRLEGSRLVHSGSADILSDATAIGSLQVPASGQPIMLMADRQTTGGYPKIATVISADLPIAGQLAPGDWVEFAGCTRSAALDALRHRRARLEGR